MTDKCTCADKWSSVEEHSSHECCELHCLYCRAVGKFPAVEHDIRAMYLPDLRAGDKPERIMLVTQLPEGTKGSVYEFFLSDQTRAAKGGSLRDYYRLRERDLTATLARFPDYEVKPPSFAGDISLYLKQEPQP